MFPGQPWIHLQIMNFLADIGISCCFGMGHGVCYVLIQAFEVSMHGRLNFKKEMMISLGCMQDFILFCEEWGQDLSTMVEPSLALTFVMGSSELSCLKDCTLVIIIFNTSGHE